MQLLFLCTGNSCRSQMTEGWARQPAPAYPDLSLDAASAVAMLLEELSADNERD